MQDTDKQITLELIEARIEAGERAEAAAMLQKFTGHSWEEVLPLIDVLDRETNSLEDVKVLKDWGWTIRASLRYQRLFGDDMKLVKKIIDRMGTAADGDEIETLIANGYQLQAAKLIRLHTGLGPDEAQAEVTKRLERKLANVIELAKQGDRSLAIRQYQKIHGCSLLDAKRALDQLSSS